MIKHTSYNHKPSTKKKRTQKKTLVACIIIVVISIDWERTAALLYYTSISDGSSGCIDRLECRYKKNKDDTHTISYKKKETITHGLKIIKQTLQSFESRSNY